LFEESKARQLRKEKIYVQTKDEECTFKPKLIAKRPKSVCITTKVKERSWQGGMEYCTFSPKINDRSSAGKRAKSRNSLNRSVQLYLNAFEIQERKIAKQLESSESCVP